MQPISDLQTLLAHMQPVLNPGLTAAFARALAQAGISRDVVAGACRDHLFVPADRARQAMDVLHALQQSVAASSRPGPARGEP